MHRLRFLGKGGSPSSGCPTLYAAEPNGYLVQGWVTDTPGTVEVPHLLTGFAEPDTYIGATMTDTGRGTFRLSGTPVTDPETLAQLTLADDETPILVPKLERTFYGAAATR
ncbi:hypothetical protein [Nocardia carnea]|uniref:hypothetical protein n=1 Tax=Nocardia carnea TaxID=37328 RepID=UPI002455807E|nr:hypothetical protein [Nocardia carnea]